MVRCPWTLKEHITFGLMLLPLLLIMLRNWDTFYCSFFADEPKELVDLQMEEWKPLVEWFGERYVSKNIRGMHHIQHFFF